jgi:AmiR/NasT family two-component response regulator
VAAASPLTTTGNPAVQTVLLVDDDRLILATLSRGLSAGGFRTLEAACGDDALRACAENPPCIAIVDYDMPGMTGLELLAKLQADPRFPVIILSAYGDETIVNEAVELGAMAYLVKPVDPSKLVPTIRTVIRRFKELSSLRTESAQLTSALKAARATSVVVGLLMERLRLPEKQAYEKLRQYCRSHNRKVTEVASEILGTAEQLNAFISDIGDSPVRALPPERKPGHPLPSR